MSNFTNTLLLYFACKNAPIKYKLSIIALLLAVSIKNYFKVLMEDVGDQVSPDNSLCCRYPLTKILNLSLSRLPTG